jgi:hypothetical protein
LLCSSSLNIILNLFFFFLTSSQWSPQFQLKERPKSNGHSFFWSLFWVYIFSTTVYVIFLWIWNPIVVQWPTCGLLTYHLQTWNRFHGSVSNTTSFSIVKDIR